MRMTRGDGGGDAGWCGYLPGREMWLVEPAGLPASPQKKPIALFSSSFSSSCAPLCHSFSLPPSNNPNLACALSLSLTPPLTPHLSITHTHTPTCPCVLKKALLMLHRFSASSSRMWSSGRSLVVIAPRTTARASTCGRCNTLRTYSTDAPRSHVRGSRVRAMLH